MKILIIRDRESSGGGIFNYYSSITPYLTSRVRFLSIGRPHAYYGGAKSRLFQCTLLRLVIEWSNLIGEMLFFQPDVVVVNPSLDPETNCRSMKRDAVSSAIAHFCGKKIVTFWRGWNNECCGNAAMPGGNEGWMCLRYKRSSAHIVLASRFKMDLVRWGFISPIYLESTVVSDTVLGCEVFPTDASKLFRILFLSRVEVAKGVFELLMAFALLEARRPGRFHLTVAGDGPDLNDLRRRAAEMHLSGIHFTGYVEGRAKSQCYAEASVFCFPSYTEGMPNAVLEAMAMGLPLVSSDAGGLKDILSEGVTGFLIRQDPAGEDRKRFSSEEIADRIERLADSEELRERMGRYNAAYAQERFAAANVAVRLEGILREVCGMPEGVSTADTP